MDRWHWGREGWEDLRWGFPVRQEDELQVGREGDVVKYHVLMNNNDIDDDPLRIVRGRMLRNGQGTKPVALANYRTSSVTFHFGKEGDDALLRSNELDDVFKYECVAETAVFYDVTVWKCAAVIYP